jgi:hypothetical protein
MIGLLVALLGSAQAGSVYVNGVKADAMRNFEFEDVNVRIDEEGNIWIDAPNLMIEVRGADDTPPVEEPPVQEPPAQDPPAETSGGETQDAAAVADEPAVEPIAAGQWWLTSADEGSVGQIIEVQINGVVVATARSGEADLALDLAPFLSHGDNQVTLIHRPDPTRVEGGALAVRIGNGTDAAASSQAPLVELSRSSEDGNQLSSTKETLPVP